MLTMSLLTISTTNLTGHDVCLLQLNDMFAFSQPLKTVLSVILNVQIPFGATVYTAHLLMYILLELWLKKNHCKHNQILVRLNKKIVLAPCTKKTKHVLWSPIHMNYFNLNHLERLMYYWFESDWQIIHWMNSLNRSKRLLDQHMNQLLKCKLSLLAVMRFRIKQILSLR